MRTFDVSYAIMIGLVLLLCFVLVSCVAADMIIQARELKNTKNEPASRNRIGWLSRKYGMLIMRKHDHGRLSERDLKLVTRMTNPKSRTATQGGPPVFSVKSRVLVLNRRGNKKESSPGAAIGNFLAVNRFAMMRRKDDELLERRMQAR
ncbi:MAG: hypothetical protein V4632_23080 [Pseudomonadota bacterium]